jgi:hypothetical protein
MRRERKREEKERRFLSRQGRLRERRQRKNSSPVEACQPAGDEHAGGRNVSAEGMEASQGEIAAAGFFLGVLRQVLRMRLENEGFVTGFSRRNLTGDEYSGGRGNAKRGCGCRFFLEGEIAWLGAARLVG